MQTKDAIFEKGLSIELRVQETAVMSKVSGRTPTKSESKDSDHKRDSRGDRGDKSHGHGRSDSRNKHSNHSKDTTDDSTQNAEVKSGEEKKFTGRCRLFVGNLTQDVSEDDFRKMFQQYGEVSEVYVNSGRGFGFVRLVRTRLSLSVSLLLA